MATEATNEMNIAVAEPTQCGAPAKLDEKMTEEQKIGVRFYREHARAAVKKSNDKALALQKWQCSLCERCFPTRQRLRYHTDISKAHK